MRFVATVFSAALVLFLLYVILSVLVDGYWDGNIWPGDLEPEAWSAPDSWPEWRDIVIVLVGVFLVFAGILTVVLLAALVYLILTIRRIMQKNLAPALDSAKEALDNIRGTAEFAGETVVSPIIRVYSIARGVRTGVRAVGNLPKRIRGRKGKK
jgi:hypothetical protein